MQPPLPAPVILITKFSLFAIKAAWSTIGMLSFKEERRLWFSLNSSKESSEFRSSLSSNDSVMSPIAFMMLSTIFGCLSFKWAILKTEVPVFLSTLVLKISNLKDGVKLTLFQDGWLKSPSFSW